MIEHAAIELHDSRVLEVRLVDGTLEIAIDAYVHRSAGRPGEAPGTGWEQAGTLTIKGASVVRRPAGGQMRIDDGVISVDGRSFSNVIPLPFQETGGVRVLLESAEGTLEVVGTELSIALHGDARYVETFD